MAARKSSLKDEDRCGQCTKHVGEKDSVSCVNPGFTQLAKVLVMKCTR